MKKLFILTVIATMLSLSVAAQSLASMGEVIGYGSEMQATTLGVRADIDLKAFTYSPSINYYFEDAGVNATIWDVTFDLHYNLLNKESVKAYPIVGFATLAMFASEASETQFCGNLGAGVRYNLNEKWAAIAEAKYQLFLVKNANNQTYVNVGIMYRF